MTKCHVCGHEEEGAYNFYLLDVPGKAQCVEAFPCVMRQCGWWGVQAQEVHASVMRVRQEAYDEYYGLVPR